MQFETWYKFCKFCENCGMNTPLLGVYIPHFDQISVNISGLCVCNYSSQTTGPISIKIILQQIERLTLIVMGYLDLKYLPPPYL